eukprot:53253-Pelagomonas_calceolata.AAC.1
MDSISSVPRSKSSTLIRPPHLQCRIKRTLNAYVCLHFCPPVRSSCLACHEGAQHAGPRTHRQDVPQKSTEAQVFFNKMQEQGDAELLHVFVRPLSTHNKM